MAEELTVHRETIEISGGRTMHLYTFDIGGEPMPEMTSDDLADALVPSASPTPDSA